MGIEVAEIRKTELESFGQDQTEGSDSFDELNLPQLMTSRNGGEAAARKVEDAFARLTPQAKCIMATSFVVARELNHGYIGTEHVLLAMFRVGAGSAPKLLHTLLKCGEESIREEIVNILGHSDSSDVQAIGGCTGRVEQTLISAAKNSTGLIDSLSILKSLIRQKGVAAITLTNWDLNPEYLEQQIQLWAGEPVRGGD